MELMKDSRQVIKDKALTSAKYFSDIIYCYLQSVSEWDGMEGHPRYVWKKKIKFNKLAGEVFQMSRQTISARVKRLIELDLVEETAEKYILKVLPGNIASLLPQITLRILTSVCNERAISIYVYLLNRYIACGEQEFIFTYTQLKNFIGLSTATRSNDYIIQDILLGLEKFELLKKEERIEAEAGEYKTVYYITYMTNYITDSKGEKILC